MTSPFAQAALYFQAGWTGVLPLPFREKFPPPEGFTGAGGAVPSPQQVAAWMMGQDGAQDPANLALRLPAGVVGIDVDDYGDKHGAQALFEMAEQHDLGPLPATWSSTSRGQTSPARIWLYRLPQADVRLVGKPCPGVDVIQHHHRYVVAAPSVHPEGGVYAWYRPDFTPADPSEVPAVADLPFLPDDWTAALREVPRPNTGGSQTATGARPSPDGWSAFTNQRAPHSWRSAQQAINRELAAASVPAALGSGYRNTLLRAALVLGGYVGASVLPAEHAQQLLAEAAGQAWNGQPDADDVKWIGQGLADGAQRPFRVYDDRGTTSGVSALSPRAAASLEHVRATGRLPDVFDPAEDNTDQGLAEAVLAELYPNLRMDIESGSFLVRGPERWQTITRDASGWAVSDVARRMPPGVRPVPKDVAERTAEHWQAWRLTKFTGTAGAAPISRKMRDRLAAGEHANHVRLSELDADPHVLWAGGSPWDLRTGGLADIDPLTPHTHAARFAPVEGPTPLWDAFVAAVWPDPEIREWALSVLSVGLTGHSPRIMPVLYGDTGRGKTQVVALLCNLLGTYGGPADQKLIIAPEAHGSVVYSLKGLRLAYVDEPAPTHRDKVERVKLLTGGGRMTGNQMRKDPVTWDSTHTLVLMQNDAPELTDDALRDRARVIACDGDPEQVARTRAALGQVNGDTISGVWAKEAPGVLAAMMRRAAAWLADPSTLDPKATPASVIELVDAMVAEQDPVQQWMSERTSPSEPGTPSRALHNDFAAWFKASPVYGRRAVPTAVDFGRRLAKLGIGTTTMRDGKYRHLIINTPGGGWFTQGPVPVPAPMAERDACDGSVTDAEGHPSQENDQVQAHVDVGVTDVTEVPQFSNQNLSVSIKSVNTGIGGSVTHPSPEVAHSASGQGELFVSDTLAGPSQSHETVTPAEPIKKTRRKPGEPTAAERKRAEKAAEKAAKVAELAGELVELPAVVRRTSPTPRHIEHVHVGPLLADAMAKSRGHLTVDCETSGYPIGHPEYALRTVQLGTRVLTVDLDADCSVCCAIATAALKRAEVLHAHNAAADIPPLHHAGIATHDELWAKMEDTVLPAKLADPSSSGGDPALKAASAAVLGDKAMSPAAEERKDELFAAANWLKDTDPTTPPERSGWLQVDKRCATMIGYACADVLDGAFLALELPEPDPAVHARERHIQRVVAPASTFGFPLDADLVLEQHDKHDVDEKRLREQLRDVLRIDNPGSSPQLAKAFMGMGVRLPMTPPSKKFPQGQPSVAKDVMNTLAELSGPAQAAARLVLDWRHHDTALKLLLRPWRIAVLQGDGRVRPTVYTLGADTGRMSCVRPNMQQISKKGGLRECILADDGFMIVSADFEGVELRVAAALSGDPILRQALEQGLDIHRMIAAQVFGEELADEYRTLAKRIVFGFIYGGGFETLAKQSGVSVETVAAAVGALRQLTPRLSEWSEEVKSAIRAGNRQFRTYSGRVIHLDPRQPHKGPNYLIQGTARELLGDTLVAWDGTEHRGGVLMPVHDEAVAMVREDRAQDGLDTLMRLMTHRLGDIAITASAGGPPARSWHSG